MPTDTSEKGLEPLIMLHMTSSDGGFACEASLVTETPGEIAASKVGGSGLSSGWSALQDKVIHVMARVDACGRPEIVEPGSGFGESHSARRIVGFVAFAVFVALTDCRRGRILPLP
jgi:hypothetical protein